MRRPIPTASGFWDLLYKPFSIYLICGVFRNVNMGSFYGTLVRKDTYKPSVMTYWVEKQVSAAMVNTAALTTTDTTTMNAAVDADADGGVSLGRGVNLGDVAGASIGGVATDAGTSQKNQEQLICILVSYII